MDHSPKKKIWAGALAALLALFAALVVATPAKAASTITSGETLASALNSSVNGNPFQVSASNANTVLLTSDTYATGNITVALGDTTAKGLTLNLQGNTLAMSAPGAASNAISVTGNAAATSVLTITNGTISGTLAAGTGTPTAEQANTLISVADKTSLTLGRSLTVTNATAVSSGKATASAPAVTSNGTLTIAGASISGPGDGLVTITGENGVLTMTSGSVTGTATAATSAEYKKNDVNVGTQVVVWLQGASTAPSASSISGGTITAPTPNDEGFWGCGVIVGSYNNNTSGNLTISEGAVINAKSNGVSSPSCVYVYSASEFTMNGGTLNGGRGVWTYGNNKRTSSGATINLNAGTINAGSDCVAVYAPSASGANSNKNTVTIGNEDGGPTITGGAGVVSLGSTVKIEGPATITATATKPVSAGDATDNEYPPAALVSSTQSGYATPGVGSVTVTSPDAVLEAAEGEPAVAYTNGSKSASTPVDQPSDAAPIQITAGNYSSPINSSYLSGVDAVAYDQGSNAPYSYWPSVEDAENDGPKGAVVSELGAVEVVSTGFSSAAANDVNAAITAAWQAAGATGKTIEDAATNTMWAIIKGSPNTQYNVYFSQPLGEDAEEPTNYVFAQGVTTGPEGLGIVYFKFAETAASGSSAVAASGLFASTSGNAPLAGNWIVTAVAATSSNYITTPDVDAVTGNTFGTYPEGAETATVSLASVTYQLQANGDWAQVEDAEGTMVDGDPAGAVQPSSSSTDYTIFYDYANTKSVALTDSTPVNNGGTANNYLWLGWYENVNEGKTPAVAASYEPVSGPVAFEEAENVNIAAGFFTGEPTLTVSPVDSTTATEPTIILGQPVNYTLTLALPATGSATLPTGISQSEITAAFNQAAQAAFKDVKVTLTGAAATTSATVNVTPGEGATATASVVTSSSESSYTGDTITGVTFTVANAEAATADSNIGLGFKIVAPLSVSTLGEGTVAQTTTDGTNITLTATPAEGWKFVGWQTPYGTTISSTNPLIVSRGSYDSIVAVFQASNVTVYRLYNPYTFEHLYTTSETEANNLDNAGWENEGTAWVAPAKSDIPIYRLYNPYNGDHMYTTSKAEYDKLDAAGWDGEGPAMYGATASATPIYRLYNPYMTENGGAFSHLWTSNYAEYKTLVKLGWTDEGTAWFAVSATGM